MIGYDQSRYKFPNRFLRKDLQGVFLEADAVRGLCRRSNFRHFLRNFVSPDDQHNDCNSLHKLKKVQMRVLDFCKVNLCRLAAAFCRKTFAEKLEGEETHKHLNLNPMQPGVHTIEFFLILL